MQGEDRRRAILLALREARGPVSAGALAERFSVSRQIIVGDVALLRAAGEEITATPRGYILSAPAAGLTCRVACRHTGKNMEAELNAIVDNGCTVEDVIVEHPIYGQITGSLQLSSRYDVKRFLERCAQCDAHPLSDLTGGIHLHTLSCPDEETFARVRRILKELGILLEE